MVAPIEHTAGLRWQFNNSRIIVQLIIRNVICSEIIRLIILFAGWRLLNGARSAIQTIAFHCDALLTQKWL